MRIAQEEIFGPVVSIIPCDNLENAIEIANNIEYGLSSALYTKDVNKASPPMRDLHAGITYINAPTIGAEVHLPFGGVKATGNGHREGGIGAIDFYSEMEKRICGLFRYLAEGADRQAGGRHFLKSTIRGLRETVYVLGSADLVILGRGNELKSCGKTCESRFLTAKAVGNDKIWGFSDTSNSLPTSSGS